MTPAELLTAINILTSIEEIRTRKLIDPTRADRYTERIRSTIDKELDAEPNLVATVTDTTRPV